MTFTEHLGELRTRIIRSAAAIGLGFFVAWQFRVELFGFLADPISHALADNGIYHYQAIQITESILVYLKTSFVFCILGTSPFTFYQFWAFVSPGLHDHEKRFVWPVTAFTVIFFLIGSAFAYQVILPFITDFLVKLTLEGGQAEVMVTLQNAYSTAFIFLLMFGLIFELPLVIFFLALFGVVTAGGLWRFFRYFVVISVVAGAMLTPPDPVSQMLMALPLNVLYGFGIIVAWGVERSREQEDGPSAGVTLTRLMGSSLLLLGIATGLVVLFVRTLPQKPLVAFVPDTASWVVGGNPAVLVDASVVQDALRGAPDALAGLADLDLAVTDVRAAAVVGTNLGLRAAMVRADQLGTREAAVAEALAGYAVAALDDDTLALGDPPLVQAMAAIAGGERDPVPQHDEEERLLSHLRGASPLWAWVPASGDPPQQLVAGALDADAAAAGGWLSFGDDPSVSVLMHAADRSRGDTLEARLDALRTLSRKPRGPATGDDAELAQILDAVVAELERDASGAQAKRLGGLRTRLEALRAGTAAQQGPLGLPVTGWSLRREDARLVLTGDLADGGAESVIGRGLTLLPTGGAP